MKKDLFIEKGLRGGISYIAKRYSKANNKYMNDYDSKHSLTFITCLDLNNLYGGAINEYVPYGGFKMLKNVYGFDIFLKLTLDILINYTNYTMMIH